MSNVTPVIDSDGHVLEPEDLWVRYMPSRLRHRAPRSVDDDLIVFRVDDVEVPRRDRLATRRGEKMPILTEQRFGKATAEHFSAASHLEGMDAEGIDVAVLFPSRGLGLLGIDAIDHELANAMARAYNDWLADFCADGRGRLLGAGMLDLHDPEAAAMEAQRCVRELGFPAVMARPNPVGGRQLYDPAYESLWATIEDLDVPICFHEGTAVHLPQVGPDRFERHAFWHACSHPMEQQIAMTAMVLGGVLHRHPQLRAGFLECGAGWLPYWMWRLDEHWEADGERDCPELSMSPSAYIRRQCYVSADSDEDTAVYTIRRLDRGNVLWGSDYPHPDSKYPLALASLRRLEGMTDEDLTAVLWENPRRFFGGSLEATASALTAGALQELSGGRAGE
jgi:predicted TIM-barrel fold metal-dependent hydrolase